MRLRMLFIFLTLCATAISAAEEVVVPWEEFKTLYRDHVEREILSKAEAPKRRPQIYSIDDARYTLTIGEEDVAGEVRLAGRVVSGDPEPIPLFGKEVIITELVEVTGGTVMATPKDGRLGFLPEKDTPVFALNMRFLVRPRDENGTWAISFTIPTAVQNVLSITGPQGTRLMECPGLAGPDGAYHFSASSDLTVRYLERPEPGVAAAPAVIEIDTISHVAVQRTRVLIDTRFLPVRGLTEPVTLVAPEGAKLVASSLKPAWFKPLEGGRYTIKAPPGSKDPFSVEFALDVDAQAEPRAFVLPRIEGNTGRQGRFAVDEPDDGQVAASAEGLVPGIPAERLSEEAQAVLQAKGAATYMTVPPQEPVTLEVHWFEPVATPSTVLESQSFYAAVEDNGNILSMIVLDIPPEFGPRLTLKAIPDSEIWSLTVNNAKRKLFEGEQDTWIIPLEPGGPSHVELAFLRKGLKLGLQGKLDVIVPATGLASQTFRIGIALPARVDLLFAEGPINPSARAEKEKPPKEFTGKPYFFDRSFYKGEGMSLALSYKEPVDQAQQRQGGK